MRPVASSASAIRSAESPRLPLVPIVLLGAAIFVAITSEFLPTGLLPEMAADLGVSTAQIGLLVTVYAGTVIVATAPLNHLTRRVPRKTLMLALLATFAVANVASALAPSYEFLVGARVLGGLAHGMFWSVTTPYIARLVPRALLTRAVALTGLGGTLGFVFGVPVGTIVGTAVGWRVAFLVVAVALVICLAAVALALPRVQHIEPLATGEIVLPLRRDPAVRPVLALCVVVLVVMTGQYLSYTYIAEWLVTVPAFSLAAIGPVLAAYGLGGALGLAISGWLGDRAPRLALPVLVGGILASALLMFVAGGHPVWALVAIGLWSIAFGGLPALVQARMMQLASPRLRDVASAWLTIFFNAAIAGGALIGALAVGSWGVEVLPLLHAGVLAIALVMVVAAGSLLESARRDWRSDGSPSGSDLTR